VTLALLSGGFQLAVAFRVDFLLTPRQHVFRRDVAGGTVQADVVVMLHVDLDQTPRGFPSFSDSGVPGRLSTSGWPVIAPNPRPGHARIVSCDLSVLDT
jgi:hypothetical protein